MNHRIVNYIQDEWSMFEVSYMLKKGITNSIIEIKRKDKSKIKSFIDNLTANINEPLGMSNELTYNESSTLIYLRTLKKRKLRRVINESVEMIEDTSDGIKVNKGSIVKLKLKSGEKELLSLLDNIYKKELATANIVGLGFLTDENLKPVKKFDIFQFKANLVSVEHATIEERRAFEVAMMFHKLRRIYGEFKTQDLLYNSEVDAYAFYNNVNDELLLEAMLDGKVHLVLSKNMLDKLRNNNTLIIRDEE